MRVPVGSLAGRQAKPAMTVSHLMDGSRKADVVWDTAKVLVGLFAGIALAMVDVNVSSTRSLVATVASQQTKMQADQAAADDIRDRTIALLQARVDADHAVQAQNTQAIQNLIQEMIHETDAIDANRQAIRGHKG